MVKQTLAVGDGGGLAIVSTNPQAGSARSQPLAKAALPGSDQVERHMLQHLARALTKAGWCGETLAGQRPTKVLSALHIEDPVGFDNAINATLRRA